MNRVRILLIDDEPLQLVGLQAIVPWEQYGYEIVGTAHNGEEGVELIGRLKPDIVVADIVMPRLDGLEMIQRAKDAGSTASFIILSCMNDIPYYKRAISCGVYEYLQKELITPELLLETVGKAAESRRRGRILEENEEGAALFNERVLETEFVSLVLQGQMNGDAAIEKKVLDWGLLPTGQPFRVGAVSVRRLGAADDMLLEYSIIRICEEILRHEPVGRFLRVSGDYLMALLPDLPEERMQTLFDRMKNTVEQCMDCVMTMGISLPGRRPGRLREMFGQARRAEELGYLYGLGRLYHSDAAGDPGLLRATPRVHRFSPPELEEELASMVTRFRQERPERRWIQDTLEGFLHRIFLLAEQALPRGVLEDVDRRRALGRLQSAATLEEAAAVIRSLISVLQSARDEGPGAGLADRVRRYVRENLYTKLTLNQIAQNVYSSPSHVSRTFKQATGINLNAYIRAQKIEEAKRLLPTRSVNEVAESLCYASVSHFVSIFSEQEGMTPYKYKKQCS